MNYAYVCELDLWLLHEFTRIFGGMGLHVYIAQGSLWRVYEGGLLMVWTECAMTKVLV